jgi:hypothetical protein
MLKSIVNSPIKSGDQTILDGNLIVGTAGKGIDFSASSHAPGMTSEILTDYEEGVWTPTLQTDNVNFTSVSYASNVAGRYTKIGNLVHFQGYISTTAVTVGSASGQVVIGGLPFTAVANNSGKLDGRSPVCIGEVNSWTTNNPNSGQVSANTKLIYLYYRSAVNGATIAQPVASVATGSGNVINFSGTYIAA